MRNFLEKAGITLKLALKGTQIFSKRKAEDIPTEGRRATERHRSERAWSVRNGLKSGVRGKNEV